MTPSEYEVFREKAVVEQEITIKASELSIPGSIDTTLLYGYTLERNSFHVYLTHDKNRTPFINVLTFDFEENVIEHIKTKEISVSRVIPNKRAYPSLTLFSFANLIKNKGEYIPFTTVNDSQESLCESNLGLKRFTI